MAGFDKTLDKELFNKDVVLETTKIKVGVYSYNENTPKLQLGRENRNMESGEWKWSKLGRMTKEEATAVLPAIEEALKNM